MPASEFLDVSVSVVDGQHYPGPLFRVSGSRGDRQSPVSPCPADVGSGRGERRLAIEYLGRGRRCGGVVGVDSVVDRAH